MPGNQQNLLLYESSLRVHDEAVDNWLDTLLVDYNINKRTYLQVPILRVNATPQRAFSQVLDLMVSRGMMTAVERTNALSAREQDFAVLPHPILTWQRGEPVYDTELASVPNVFRRKWFNEAENQWELHRYPAHARTEYTLTIRCEKKYSEAYIREWFYSKIGPLGAGHAELFLPVNHGTTWGIRNQSFRLMNSNDETMYEGNDPRFIRFSFVFSLRTWIFYKPTLVPPIFFIETDILDGSKKYGLNNISTAALDVSPILETPNMFMCQFGDIELATAWPVTGTATIVHATPNLLPVSRLGNPTSLALQVNLNTGGDTATLAQDETVLDGDGYSIAKLSFNYLSDNGCTLQFSHRPLNNTGSTFLPSYTLDLSPAPVWQKVCKFVLFTDAVFQAELVYASLPSVNYIDSVVVTVILPPSKQLTSRIDDGIGNWTYTWTGLRARQYFVVFAVTAGTGTAQVVGGRSESVDATQNAGSVLLTSPDPSGNITAKVSKSLTLSAVYIQPYNGSFPGDGTEV